MSTDLAQNDEMPQIHVSPASERASSRARIIWMIVPPPWPPTSSGSPMAWNPASDILSQSSVGYSNLATPSRGQVLRCLLLHPVVHHLAEHLLFVRE